MPDSGFDPQDNAPFNERVISEFRANKGRVDRAWLDKDLVLITTTGAKSGKPRVNPLVYVADGDRVVVAASNSGLDRHPAWYFNVKANPELTVELGEEKYRATASETTGPERDERPLPPSRLSGRCGERPRSRRCSAAGRPGSARGQCHRAGEGYVVGGVGGA
ncbi:nitroreductase/quinone reductase family protein [Streptomyces mayonensis]|uniref:nitroreductase/quinone reductase family protein n=1 Tax=Streptomyces mayonensis TaxID=2750816 RepID=UPI001C1E5B84|nr:nitroreductase/quinone reductase family protein [Streptomyces sp. A108]MBU6532987.1 nitroreductase family deazaflavin-dependent oxidoreductase [Streptomyces sp. A108]